MFALDKDHNNENNINSVFRYAGDVFSALLFIEGRIDNTRSGYSRLWPDLFHAGPACWLRDKDKAAARVEVCRLPWLLWRTLSVETVFTWRRGTWRKQDADLHDIAEIVIKMSQERVVTMKDYNEIVEFMKRQGDEELDRIRKLGGMWCEYQRLSEQF